MAYLPTDVANQALDAIGSEVVLGDLEEGTKEAQVILRAYTQCVRQLLRSAHWDFARKTAQLTLIADASGATSGVGTQVPLPWMYEYAYPIDCVKVRFVPNSYPIQSGGLPGNITTSYSSVPATTGGTPTSNPARVVPARFVVATDFNYTPQSTSSNWEQPGVSPIGQTVILTNVQSAYCVYTAYMNYPSVWDPLFRAAMVAYLASEVALSLSKDKAFGLKLRAEQIMIAKEKIKQARISDGNEGWYSTDHTPDWMRVRISGVSGANWQGMNSAASGCWGSYDSIGFADGSAF